MKRSNQDGTNLTTPPVPRLLDQSLAAAYLGLSERAFEMNWRRHKMPAPFHFGRRLLWDRKILDLFVDSLSELAQAEFEDVPEQKRERIVLR